MPDSSFFKEGQAKFERTTTGLKISLCNLHSLLCCRGMYNTQ